MSENESVNKKKLTLLKEMLKEIRESKGSAGFMQNELEKSYKEFLLALDEIEDLSLKIEKDLMREDS